MPELCPLRVHIGLDARPSFGGRGDELPQPGLRDAEGGRAVGLGGVKLAGGLWGAAAVRAARPGQCSKDTRL